MLFLPQRGGGESSRTGVLHIKLFYDYNTKARENQSKVRTCTKIFQDNSGGVGSSLKRFMSNFQAKYPFNPGHGFRIWGILLK